MSAAVKGRLFALSRLLRFLRPLYWLPFRRRFEIITRRIAWGGRESISGVGSDLDATVSIRAALPGLLSELCIKTILDAPCGDFNWMKQVPLAGINYIGMDILPQLIQKNIAMHHTSGREFIVGDITRDPMPNADIVLCRDCLVHLSNRLGLKTLSNFHRSGATYLLTTTFPEVTANHNIPSGAWRPLNLTLPPFNLPHPLLTIPDADNQECASPLVPPLLSRGGQRGGVLGLWRLADLPTWWG